MNNNVTVAFEEATGKTFESFKKVIFAIVDSTLAADGIPSLDPANEDQLETVANIIQEEVAGAVGVSYPQFNELSSFLTSCYVDVDLD